MRARTSTPNGVPKEYWDKVHDLALAYANETVVGAPERAERARQRMLRLLNALEKKFGERPSLLATRSDYVIPTAYRERLLLRAFTLARTRRDGANRVFVSSSLASFYIEDVGNVAEGEKWLAELESALGVHPDETERRTWRNLAKLVRGKRSS